MPANAPGRQSAVETAAGLRWRLRILQTLDRALARNHCRRSRLRGTAGSRCALSRRCRAPQFENAVKLIETDGRVFSGAEAVYRSLGKGGGSGFGRWGFEHVPGFAPISNYAYGFIARHRELAHTVTSLFWGKDVRRPTYFQARRWFLALPRR